MTSEGATAEIIAASSASKLHYDMMSVTCLIIYYCS